MFNVLSSYTSLSSRRTFALAIVLSWMIPVSAQNFITNGTFDTAVPSNSTGGSWTSSNISGGGWVNVGGNPGAYFILNAAGQTATNPRMEQTISGLTIGQTYTVTGEYQIHVPLGDPANSFGVLIDATVILQLGNPGTNWTPFTANFDATSTSHVLALEAERNDSDHSYSIDNISVVAAVPEPGTWAMIAVTICGTTVVGWRFKKKRFRRRSK